MDLSDTQPNPRHDDTQPTSPIGARRPNTLLILAALASAALAIVGGIALISTLTQRPAPPPLVHLTLIVDGLAEEVTTDARTVRELLEREGITLTGSLAVDPSPDTRLQASMTVLVDDQRPVTLTVDGATSVFRTVIENPSDILRAAGVTIDQDDEVIVNGAPVQPDQLRRYPLPANRISIRHALTVSLIDGDLPAESLITTADTVGDALAEADVTLYLGDSIEPPVESALEQDMQIVIDRSLPVTVELDGSTTVTRTQAERVGALLDELNITLNGFDYAVPPVNARLRAGMTVRIVRVTEEVIVEPIEVPYERVTLANAEMELDTTAITTAGVAGRDERRIRIRYENGVEVRRFDEGVVRVQDPVNEVLSYGTRLVYRTVDTPDGPREYWRKLRMYATSYHPAALGGDSITAIGETLRKGIVGSDPRIIPYRSQVYVPGYGVGMMADTGNFARPLWIDLGYDDNNWVSWSRPVDVYLLAPVPENIEYLLPG